MTQTPITGHRLHVVQVFAKIFVNLLLCCLFRICIQVWNKTECNLHHQHMWMSLHPRETNAAPVDFAKMKQL